MERTPFYGYIEQAWIDHQTDYGQHPDPCKGLSCDQLYQRIDQWLAEFNPLLPPDSETALGIRVGIVHRFYRDIAA